jgi:hypothetical protein
MFTFVIFNDLGYLKIKTVYQYRLEESDSRWSITIPEPYNLKSE